MADLTRDLRPLGESELVLVLGGQRSGKSAVAESLAATGSPPVTYVATARPSADPSLATRIAAHRQRRDPAWDTVEIGDDLGLPSRGTVLLDSLGMWVAGLAIPAEPASVARQLRRPLGPTVVVSDEVGLGVIPATEAGVRFADDLGAVNHAVAAVADRVYLVVAGRVVVL